MFTSPDSLLRLNLNGEEFLKLGNFRVEIYPLLNRDLIIVVATFFRFNPLQTDSHLSKSTSVEFIFAQCIVANW